VKNWFQNLLFKCNLYRYNAEAGETTHPQLTARVTLAYEQALMSLVHFPDVWLELATWHENEQRLDEAAAVLLRARESIPGCALLSFAAADCEEARGNVAGAKAVYESLIEKHEESAAAAAAEAAAAAAATPYTHPPMDNSTLLVYIEYMRCVRRMEGQQPARKAFMRARKAPGLRWEIFAAAALLEWRYDHSDKPARNIFELGLKSFIGVPHFIAQYSDFLVGCNDVANARVLFERAVAAGASAASSYAATPSAFVTAAAAAKAREKNSVMNKEVWDLFVAFEQTHGTMETMSAVERRRHAALGSPGGGADSAAAMITALMGRHSFLSLRAATTQQVQHFTRLGASIPKLPADAAGAGGTGGGGGGVSRYAAARGGSAAGGTAGSATAAAVAAAAKAAKTSAAAKAAAAKKAAAAAAAPRPAPPTGKPLKAAPGSALPKAPTGGGGGGGIAPLPPPPAPGKMAVGGGGGDGRFAHLPSELASFILRLPAAGGAPVQAEIQLTHSLQSAWFLKPLNLEGKNGF
jgi:hypothetical protein